MNRRRASRNLITVTLFALGVAACTKDKAAPVSITQATTEGKPAADPDIAVFSIIGVDIDTKLAAICGLAQSSVFFKFDSAKLLPAAKDRLDQIAKCATEGAAKGKDLVVIGRTDPVGTDEYNKALGMSRADSVAKYLREDGVVKTRVETESKGESAAANDPYGWPTDRRVTVRLQP